ncbi:MAG: hypothetical protein CSA75_03085 [Sorangium cellulosum]|nr:MAG: hypothetical protein CSA75_03085 [Sorangium cellulosum]
MQQRFPAIVLLCLGLGAAAAFVATSIDTEEALAAKRRKGPKGSRAKPGRGRSDHARSIHVRSAHTTQRSSSEELEPVQRTARRATCPSEMVNVGGRFCIDRWEASVVDAKSGRPLSPYYPPHPRLAKQMHRRWQGRFRKEVFQSRSLMMDAGILPPRGLGEWDANPMTWLYPNGFPADAGDLDDASEPEVQSGSANQKDEDAGLQPLVPSVEAPHGWVLLNDAGDDALPRPVMLVPILPPWQLDQAFQPKAVSRQNVRPQGYVPGFVAALACRAAEKRLCREEEWVHACKGESQTKHPYGDRYRQGGCNVFRHEHPARIIHGSFSIGLSDPRLNTVQDKGELLLKDTGTTSTCKSVWGNDAIYDMVGNVDEWVDDPSGVFVGGFFSRNTREGCESRVGAHSPAYFDYSTGFRCCADLVGGDS